LGSSFVINSFALFSFKNLALDVFNRSSVMKPNLNAFSACSKFEKTHFGLGFDKFLFASVVGFLTCLI
jgi:hypothetical protein